MTSYVFYLSRTETTEPMVQVTKSQMIVDESLPVLVYTVLGTTIKYQYYIWQSIKQARVLNPFNRIIVIFHLEGYENSKTEIEQNQKEFNFEIVFYDDLAKTSKLIEEFRSNFFVLADMVPIDGNKDFVRFTTERLIILNELALSYNLKNVFHLENDNMMYIEMKDMIPYFETCNIGVAIPIIDVNQAAVSIIYFREAKDIESLGQFIISMYKKGRAGLEDYMKTNAINDMTLVYKYLSEVNKSETNRRVTTFPTWIIKENDNCLWNEKKVIYDGAAIGQYFGGTHVDPHARWYEPQRPFKELKGKILIWKPCFSNKSAFCPWIDDRLVVNLHIHSKQLQRFYSLNPEISDVSKYDGQ
ncbi:hypothetical protein ROZALSC1DRAFT_28182 [Rozella allomycis CSF55]|uniref:Nucleotide-diphospho-sugar transferase domain-containing protein n=1 Tax=Rozella allomycis (strain CSF55) TaxID=988480 RepID=A0A4V1J049_ROZAC|nr:hypothetical protein ROZALSC1DRAFT_28182 [Rozella allomycis CSF55]